MHGVHFIIFTWSRPKLGTAQELVMALRVLEDRPGFIAQFRSQLHPKPPRIRWLGGNCLKSHPVEFVRVIEPFDLLLAFIIAVVVPACALASFWFEGTTPHVDFERIMTVVVVIGVVLALYFGSLFLAFRSYQQWLDVLEQKAKETGLDRPMQIGEENS